MNTIQRIAFFLLFLSSFKAAGQYRRCEVRDYFTTPFNEYAAKGRVLGRVKDGFRIQFVNDPTPRTYRPSELASISGKSGNYCVGDEVFAVSLPNYVFAAKEHLKQELGITSAIRGIYPNVNVDGNAVIKGVYRDGTVVVELPGGETRRVTTYILAAKQGHTPDNALHVGEKIPWANNKELTIRGIFENGDVAVSENKSSLWSFRIPTSVIMIKKGQGRNGYIVGDTVSSLTSSNIKGIIWAIDRNDDSLYVEMTGGDLLFECADCPLWQRSLARWSMAEAQVVEN